MFPLLTNVFPNGVVELERLLNASIRKLLVTENDPVRVVDGNYPALRDIEINLSGAAVRPDAPKPRVANGETAPALTAERLSLAGEGISIGPVSVSLALRARDVYLQPRQDAEGEIVLGLERATDGSVEISTGTSDLESALAKLGQTAADKHGVTIEDVRLTLRQLGPSQVEAEATVRARKMLFATTVRLQAKLGVDDALNATVSDLKCTGDGAIGSLACGLLTPQSAEA